MSKKACASRRVSLEGNDTENYYSRNVYAWTWVNGATYLDIVEYLQH